MNFAFWSAASSAVDEGRKAFGYYHAEAARNATFRYSIDEALSMIAGGPGERVTNFLDGFGTAIQSIQSSGFLWDSKTQDAMENLAVKANGKLPTMQSFFNALNDSAQQISYVQLSKEVTAGVAKDTVKAAVEVGKTVSTTLSTLNTLFPIVVVGGILFIVFQRTKQIAGSGK